MIPTIKTIIVDAAPIINFQPVVGMVKVSDHVRDSIHFQRFLDLVPIQFLIEYALYSVYSQEACRIEDLVKLLTDMELYEPVRLIQDQPNLGNSIAIFTDAAAQYIASVLLFSLKRQDASEWYRSYLFEKWESNSLMVLTLMPY